MWVKFLDSLASQRIKRYVGEGTSWLEEYNAEVMPMSTADLLLLEVHCAND
jgi:hypothetical protein